MIYKIGDSTYKVGDQVKLSKFYLDKYCKGREEFYKKYTATVRGWCFMDAAKTIIDPNNINVTWKHPERKYQENQISSISIKYITLIVPTTYKII